jgi:hypothetical protein
VLRLEREFDVDRAHRVVHFESAFNAVALAVAERAMTVAMTSAVAAIEQIPNRPGE